MILRNPEGHLKSFIITFARFSNLSTFNYYKIHVFLPVFYIQTIKFMKSKALTLMFCLINYMGFAQVEMQTDTVMFNNKPLIATDRIDLLKNVDVIANMQYGLNSYWQG